MKRRLDRRDMLILLISAFVFAAQVIIYIRLDYAFGSGLDWSNQHYAIPDSFRKLFYETGELFPSFAPNLGAGENIYYFSYYGLYSPVIMLSYLMPQVSMALYIQVSSAVLCFVGGALFYRFMRKRCTCRRALLMMICYLTATPVFLHSHRHIMFVNYLPFLILALEAVDSFFEGRGKWRLTLWTLMIILTSWFFSVSALVAVTVYGVYRYLSVAGKFSLADFAKLGCSFALRIINAVLIAGVLLLPTVHVGNIRAVFRSLRSYQREQGKAVPRHMHCCAALLPRDRLPSQRNYVHRRKGADTLYPADAYIKRRRAGGY